MEYQKIANLLNDESNKPPKFRIRHWVEINDEVRGTYSPNKQIQFKTSMLASSLCDYSDTYILVKGNITVNNSAGVGAAANNTNKKVIFKNCASFTNCISKTNNTQIDNAEYIDNVMPMYNLIEYSDSYSKTSGILWQYCKEIPALNDNGAIVNFNDANVTDSFNFKAKITGQTAADNNNGNIAGRVDAEIMVPLKYLSNFWRTLEMSLINCEIELILTWSRDFVIIYTNVDNQVPTFTTTETNLYVPVVTLSTQDNAKLLPQLKSSFKRTLSWNKYLAKPELLAQNAKLNHLIEPSFQGVNRRFVLAFENDAQRTSNKRYYIPNVEIKDDNVMINGKNLFDQPINNMIKASKNIRKVTTSEGDEYATGCLLDYNYFKKYYKMIAVDLSKQQALDADPKAIQQINFTANLDRAGNTRFISFLKKQNKLFLNFHKEL